MLQPVVPTPAAVSETPIDRSDSESSPAAVLPRRKTSRAPRRLREIGQLPQGA
jgi:hypothetical protein